MSQELRSEPSQKSLNNKHGSFERKPIELLDLSSFCDPFLFLMELLLTESMWIKSDKPRTLGI